MEIFFENLERIEAHNKLNDETYTLGLNEDSDRSLSDRAWKQTAVRFPTKSKRSLSVGLTFSNLKVTIPKSRKYQLGTVCSGLTFHDFSGLFKRLLSDQKPRVVLVMLGICCRFRYRVFHVEEREKVDLLRTEPR